MKSIKQITASVIIVTGSAVSVYAADTDIPRTQWGQPDLQGVWNFSTDIPLQRPERYGDREFLTREEIAEIAARRLAAAELEGVDPDPDAANRAAPEAGTERFSFGYDNFWYEMGSIAESRRTSQIVYPKDGRLPPAREGVTRQFGGLGDDQPGSRPVRFGVGGIAKDGPEDRGLSERCLVGLNGPPYSPSRYNNNIQIIQSQNTVAIVNEMIHDTHIIPLDGRPPVDGRIRFWTGDSRGYWDGDTLVVETRNFNDLTQSFSSYGNSYNKILTERFTRLDYDSLEYQYTIEDPTTFTDKITVILPMGKVAGQIYEYACNEGNYGMVNMLRGERMKEARAD